jgi:cation diffusion facilitator family transporter
MGGLRIARRDPTEEYPFGYGRAETLATAVVALMLVGAAAGIAIEAVREILTPHHLPAPWTLAVLAAVVIVKWLISRLVEKVGNEIDSTAVKADAWHHLSDAVTSTAACGAGRDGSRLTTGRRSSLPPSSHTTASPFCGPPSAI